MNDKQQLISLQKMQRLLLATQELNLCRGVEEAVFISRNAARDLGGADAVAFIIRQGAEVLYVDETSSAPMFKGKRFPSKMCASTQAIESKLPLFIHDVRTDNRVPLNFYGQTRVRSVMFLPVSCMEMETAIALYWFQHKTLQSEETATLRALTEALTAALEHQQVVDELMGKLRERATLISKLSAQVRQLEDFCNIISHNLRSPVANLRILIELLDETSDLGEKEEIIKRFAPVVGSLNTTFTQLMDATQIRMDQSVKRNILSLEESLEKVKDSLQGEMLESGAEISCDFSEADYVTYSPKYLDSIFHNLISNAIRYRSPERSPRIACETMVRDNWVYLKVRDNGLGIDLERYGSKLFRLNKTFHRHPDSKGFGLFITKTQVESMGGKIWAESNPDFGCTFVVKLHPV